MTRTDAPARPRTAADDEAEDLRILRDLAIHAAVCSRRDRAGIAREHGISLDEVDAAVRSVDATLRALSVAAHPPVPRPAKPAPSGWPPARIRNCLVREFGIPEGRVADPALVAEVVSRSELSGMHLMGESAVRSVADFLAAHGFALRD